MTKSPTREPIENELIRQVKEAVEKAGWKLKGKVKVFSPLVSDKLNVKKKK